MNKIILKSLSKNNLENLRLWRNKNRNFFLDPIFITKETQEEWYKCYKKNVNDTVYIIYMEDKPVGAISTSLCNEGIEIGRVMIGDNKYRRKGIMSNALSQIFLRHKDKDFFLKVIKTNTGAVNFYLKHGFKIKSGTKNYYIMGHQNEKQKK